MITKRPLGKAHLTLSTEAGLESVSLSSKEDGTFTGFLPHLGRWHPNRARSENASAVSSLRTDGST